MGGEFHELASLSASARPRGVSPILDTSSVVSPALASLSACLMKVALIIVSACPFFASVGNPSCRFPLREHQLIHLHFPEPIPHKNKSTRRIAADQQASTATYDSWDGA